MNYNQKPSNQEVALGKFIIKFGGYILLILWIDTRLLPTIGEWIRLLTAYNH